VFVVGTAVQNFVIIDTETVQQMMHLAGSSAEEARTNAPGFVTGFRTVGCLYILGNAVGLLARTGRAWVFWSAIAVNVTQAAGLVAIPSEVFEVTHARFGAAGLLPSLVTDGGAAVLALALIVALVRFRRPWAYLRGVGSGPGSRPG
jgi:hypothetical protein